MGLAQFQELFSKHNMGFSFALHLSHRHTEHKEGEIQVEELTGNNPLPNATVTTSSPQPISSFPNAIPHVWVIRRFNTHAKFYPIEFIADDGSPEAQILKKQAEELSVSSSFALEFLVLQEDLFGLTHLPIFGAALIHPKKQLDGYVALETSTKEDTEIVTIVHDKDIDKNSPDFVEAVWEMGGPWTQKCVRLCLVRVVCRFTGDHHGSFRGHDSMHAR